MAPRGRSSLPQQDPGQDRTVAEDLTEEDALPVLRDREIIAGQRIPWSSNYTFLVNIDSGPGRHLRAVYKPRDGERPLYDFPDGTLYKREYAAYLLSRSLGWPDVPLTLVRDGPYGVGTMQLYVECDPRTTYFDLIDDHEDQLRKFAVFDLLANNADRKGGHCLLGADGSIWSIDHGLTFHPHFKVRTVMLEFWGARIPHVLVADLEALAGRLGTNGSLAAGLSELLTEEEFGTLRGRIKAILADPVIPQMDPRRNVPWPLE